MAKQRFDETSEWLNYLQPDGLVLGANVVRNHLGTPQQQTAADNEEVAVAFGVPSSDGGVLRKRNNEPLLDVEDKDFVLHDPWPLFRDVLGWSEKFVAGSPGGPKLDPNLTANIEEHATVLSPDLAVLWRGEGEENVPAQALVHCHPEIEADQRHAFDGWEASPHQRLERLIRETGVNVGILIARNSLRLIYAPHGETSGSMTWPLAALTRVEGRPMLAGLKESLSASRFFRGPPEQRLRPLLQASREAQNEVSEKLSEQVLGALHELMRGLHAADTDRIEQLADDNPHHLYEGLLTCLMRLVFLLYAEDRDLMPTSQDAKAKVLYESGYSIKTLYSRLSEDAALNPDTMDQRRGGWGQLLAVFRLVHGGYGDWITGRGGKLFDPEGFPFLEGRKQQSGRTDARVLAVSDGCIMRILHGLMSIESRINGEWVRERLSYRTLDVEQIGSVYETVMGFTAGRATERMLAFKPASVTSRSVDLA